MSFMPQFNTVVRGSSPNVEFEFDGSRIISKKYVNSD